MSEVGSFEKAREIVATYELCPRTFLLGSVERALTIHAQQRRAHNLAWSLAKLRGAGEVPFKSVCIVGAGVTGLTLAACLASILPDIKLVMLESRTDLCPLQQGSETRWVHPNIYDWPGLGSRMPRASVPVLSWSEGRASDVAQEVLRKFAAYCDEFSMDARQEIYIGTGHIKIDAATGSVDWIGTRAARHEGFFEGTQPMGLARSFDLILVCAGFGLERYPEGFESPSYWRNDNLSQPILDGTRRTVLISGIGDGALVDLFRLTVERFRQDTMFEELFDRDLSTLEVSLRRNITLLPSESLWSVLTTDPELKPILKRAEDRLRHRIRKDTIAILHAGGASGERRAVSELFGPGSSVLNRLLLYLLYRCGAFQLALGTFEDVVSRYRLPPQNFICRHGTDPRANVLAMFTDPAKVVPRLTRMHEDPQQSSSRLWPLGSFPHL